MDIFRYRYVGVLGVIALLLATCAAVIAPSANAHTPKGGADCDRGVWSQGRSYSAADTNTLTVELDGTAQSKVFAVNGDLAVAIPSDGVEHSYAWAVDTTNHNAAYKDSGSGVITCGEPPVVETPTPTPTPSVPPVTEPPNPTPSEPTTPPVTETPTVPPAPTPSTPVVLHKQTERCLGTALIVTTYYSVDNGVTWKQLRMKAFNGHRKCFTPPAEPKKRVRTLESCLGNALVRKYQRLIGNEWTTFMTRYYEGAKRCKTPPGAPPVQEEGF